MEPGGRIDLGETPVITAHRELRKKTANLINIKSDILQTCLYVHVKSYIAYIMYITNISRKYYLHNVYKIRSCIDDLRHTAAWQETSMMIRVNLYNILHSIKSGSSYIIDTDGVHRELGKRTINVVRKAELLLYNLLKTTPEYLYNKMITHSRMSCLIGTYTFYASSHYDVNPLINNYVYTNVNTPITYSMSVQYAVYIIPNLYNTPLYYLKNCNNYWGGIHVTLAGYSSKYDYNTIKKIIHTISHTGNNLWHVNTLSIKNNTIYFKSKTLDYISLALNKIGFEKVRSNIYHISIPNEYNCSLPHNIQELLAHITWSFVIVQRSGSVINWLDHYPVRMFA
jgi:hypothetical protein